MGMDFETRKRFADKAGEKTRAFWLRAPRFIQQVGDSGPEYIVASPEAPVMVLLPHGEKITRTKKDGSTWQHDEYKPDPMLVLVVDGDAQPSAPQAPVPAHLPPKGIASVVQKAAEKMAKKASQKADDSL